VLRKCRELVHLNLDGSGMGSKQFDRSSRAGSFAGVLEQRRRVLEQRWRVLVQRREE
jgi:hypothetical protein